MYPTENITMPQEDNQNLNDVLTTMATGAIPAEAEVSKGIPHPSRADDIIFVYNDAIIVA